MTYPTPLSRIAAGFNDGSVSALKLAETALARIHDEGFAPGAQIFTRVYDASARAEALAADHRRAAGLSQGPLAGLPISIKDLFDVAGETTMAGSVVMKDAAPAMEDAPIVARLRAAGAVITGKTNMTEFAFSGVGLNPHYGTPGNVFDADRIPGGSSAGAGISVVKGMAAAAIGTDTGGSIRIPANFAGIVGFKPSQARVPLDGALPLSSTQDSIGPLAPTVACCALVDAVLAGEAPRILRPRAPETLTFAVARGLPMDGVDDQVANAYDAALKRLRDAGVRLIELELPEIAEVPQLNAAGGFSAAESWAWHRAIIETGAERYDPRVLSRIRRGEAMGAADYIDLIKRRRRMVAAADLALRSFDGLLMPTVPIVPPRIADLADDADYTRLNLLVLRNPTFGNVLDLCGVTLPIAEPGALPAGLMLLGRNGADHDLLDVAAGVEALVVRTRAA
ncbi:amidase [Tistrella mobilis]|uniref:amidase n=1 Tax=Tistrella mobilis TaxID=171437 RepID=UPI0035560507